MPAGGKKGNKGGTGSVGYGKSFNIVKNIDKYSKLWWDEIGSMMKGKVSLKEINKEVVQNKISPLVMNSYIKSMLEQTSREKMFAMSEFNKIQVKRVPQDLNIGNQDGNAFKIIVEEYVKK